MLAIRKLFRSARAGRVVTQEPSSSLLCWDGSSYRTLFTPVCRHRTLGRSRGNGVKECGWELRVDTVLASILDYVCVVSSGVHVQMRWIQAAVGVRGSSCVCRCVHLHPFKMKEEHMAKMEGEVERKGEKWIYSREESEGCYCSCRFM